MPEYLPQASCAHTRTLRMIMMLTVAVNLGAGQVIEGYEQTLLEASLSLSLYIYIYMCISMPPCRHCLVVNSVILHPVVPGLTRVPEKAKYSASAIYSPRVLPSKEGPSSGVHWVTA